MHCAPNTLGFYECTGNNFEEINNNKIAAMTMSRGLYVLFDRGKV